MTAPTNWRRARLGLAGYLSPTPPDPVISQVSPISGEATDSVTVTGAGFLAGTTFTFGGVAATSVVIVSGSTATMVLPAHANGAVDVVVQNPNGRTDTLAGGFEYAAGGGGGAGEEFFRSGWLDGGTGTGDSAVDDAGKWTDHWNFNTSVAEVISAAAGSWPAGWPTSRVLSIVTDAPVTAGRAIEVQDLDIEDDEDWYISFPVNFVDRAGGQAQVSHHSTINNTGNIQLVTWTAAQADSAEGYRPQINCNVQGGPSGNSLNNAGWNPEDRIPYATWFEFQLYIQKLPGISVPAGQMACRVWPRLYDEDGVLLYDADSYYRRPGWGGDPNESLGEYWAAGNYFILDEVAIANRLGHGFEGRASWPVGHRHDYGLTRLYKGDWPPTLAEEGA